MLLKATKWMSVGILVAALAIGGYLTYRLSQKDLFGWRLNFNLSKVETSVYTGLAPNISFLYPRTFEVDLNRERYGKGYIAGIKLKTDDRTGCDIRIGGPELDYSKSAEELAGEVVAPIRDKASGFELLSQSKTTVGGRDALRVSFSFLDPIGARVRLDQVFVADEGVRYYMICGTGEYQYAFFRKDFDLFYDSIDFSDNARDFETGKPWYRIVWQELMFWR